MVRISIYTLTHTHARAHTHTYFHPLTNTWREKNDSVLGEVENFELVQTRKGHRNHDDVVSAATVCVAVCGSVLHETSREW